jgi:hypothetical protein
VKTSGTVTEEARKRFGDKESRVEPEINLKAVHRERHVRGTAAGALTSRRVTHPPDYAMALAPRVERRLRLGGRGLLRGVPAARAVSVAWSPNPSPPRRPLRPRAVKGDALVVVKHGPTVVFQ